ncbi:ferritin [Corynebacterium lubricantis]|uniref:ferritin n=1 Tax=Corynebacterium lubricantis TaxID=541095 RepID=UPI000366AF61|nr:ferritin [Corynebacterium lubricantis]
MKIPDKLLETMNAQVTAEHQAALIYTQLAYSLDGLSFPGMSGWMYAQAEEERKHAKMIADHILARGGDVELGTIEIPAMAVKSPLDAFNYSLEHEQKVSEMIRNLARVADEVGDLDSRSLVNWFLSEQIEEEDNVSEIIEQIKLVGEDGSGLLRIDSDLGARNTQAEQTR